MNIFLLQKGSPYLYEVNELIELARQSGLFANINKLMPNATECATNADVQRSHMAQDMKVVLKLENIYGMIVLLGLGLVGGAITFMVEIVIKKWELNRQNAKGKSAREIQTEKEVDIGHGAMFNLGIGPKEDGVTEIE